MGRIVKVVAIVFGAVVVLVIAAAVIIGMLVDPNDYKDQITNAVAQQTGRELTLPGDLELQVFPTVRIAIGEASLSNAPGFGNEPFARIESAELEVGLLPLLSRRVEISQARLSGLVLNLARNAQGQNNWQDLGSGATAAQAEDSPAVDADGGTLNLDVGAVQVANANIRWADAATGSSWDLQNFNLEASSFSGDVPFPVAMDFDLSGPQIRVAVIAEGRASLALAENTYRLANLDVALIGSGSGWPGGEGEANVGFGLFEANLNQERVNLEDLELEILGMQINGTLQGENLMSNLSLSGAIEIADFDPRDLLASLDLEIETADPDVLTSASASANFVYDANQMGMRNMQLALDDSSLTGNIRLEREVLRFALAVDSINIDRYLPPGAEEDVEDEGSVDEVDLPIEPLRTFRSSGTLAFDETQFLGLKFSDASFALEAGNGRLTITPRASLYGGSYAGSIGITVVGDAARLDLVQSFDSLALGPFAQDYLQLDTLTGTGDLSLNVSATGSNLGEIQRALAGDVAFAFTDGTWDGFDAFFELRRARARFDSEDIPPRPAGPRMTAFDSIGATGTLEDSVLTNEDFSVRLPFMALDGRGTVNLLSEAIEFDFDTRFIDGPMLQEDPLMAGLADAQLPLKVSGTLLAPSILPNWGALARARVQQEVQEVIEEEREELEDRLRDRVRGLFDR